jgi:hypothetical protein
MHMSHVRRPGRWPVTLDRIIVPSSNRRTAISGEPSESMETSRDENLMVPGGSSSASASSSALRCSGLTLTLSPLFLPNGLVQFRLKNQTENSPQFIDARCYICMVDSARKNGHSYLLLRPEKRNTCVAPVSRVVTRDLHMQQTQLIRADDHSQIK